MRLPATKFIVLNAAAGLVGLAALVTAAQSVLMPAKVAPCSERYLAMTAFALERAGTMLTAADLQAGLGGRDVGVIDNVVIGHVTNAPAPLAMGVAVHKAAGEAKGGMAFPWSPRTLQAKTSGCLSYHVLFPADFDFGRGGALPGLDGGDAGEQGTGFLARIAWLPKGAAGATVRVTENGATRAIPAERESFQLPRGKWVRLDQEVVLNTPAKNDGTLRVWIDGTLVIERTDMTYRTKSDVTISGVSVDVFYGSGPEDTRATAAKEAKIWLTPFEVRWQ